MKKHTKNTAEPLVSIITPLYNAAQFIEETLSSIQAQTYPNWEHILVDDASTDGAIERVILRAKKDDRIKVLQLPENKGAAYARNVATTVAKGTYIAFLDADDLWHPEKLTKQIQYMEAHNCLVSFTSYLHIDEHSKELGRRILALPELTYDKQHRNNYIGNLTGVYNAKVLGKISAPEIRKRQDWAVWLEAIKRSGHPAKGIQEDLASYRIRKDSMSASKKRLVKYNYLFYRKYMGYSPLKSCYWLLCFFWEYFIVRPRFIKTV